MRKLFSSVALLCLGAAAALAVDVTALKPQGYVNDFAGVVDVSSRQRLEQYCASLEQTTGVQFAIVTVRSLDGEAVEQVANDLFRKWGIGQKGKDNGILLLLSIGDRRSRIETGYGLEPAITDGLAGSVLRSMQPYLRAGQYGDALMVAADAIGSRISQAKDAIPGVPPPQPHRQRQHQGGLPVGLIFAGIILFFVLSGMMGGRRGGGGGGSGIGGFLTGMLLGNLLGGGGRGWGDRRGGGFGGFDSGGGFGGFGGGDSGGGGASGSW